MKQFALFCWQSRQLSEAQQKQRTTEVVAWVKQQISDGRKLEPRVLSPEQELVVSERRNAASTNGAGALVAINFLEAKDFEEAVKNRQNSSGPSLRCQHRSAALDKSSRCDQRSATTGFFRHEAENQPDYSRRG